MRQRCIILAEDRHALGGNPGSKRRPTAPVAGRSGES